MSFGMNPFLRKRTATVRAGLESDEQHGAVIPPIHLSSNFSFAGFDQKRPYDYTRSGNPTRDLLVQALAELEGAKGGVVTSSGMSAASLVLHSLDQGARVLAPHDCYGGTFRLLCALQAKGAIHLDLVDQRDRSSLEAALEKDPSLIWVETPSNPLLRLTDIQAVAEARSELAPRAKILVDNTFLSPALQQPLSLGADLVLHSTTKYLNGHSDVVGGCVLSKTLEDAEELQWWANCLGLTGAPFDAWLTLRGLRSLHARLRCHEENAHFLARHLEMHPLVAKVHYPGLASHPEHKLALRQQQGFGGMLSFELDGDPSQLSTFLSSLQHFSLAESLGGVESLIAHPATMTHAAMDEKARERAGISPTLLRLSVGIESSEDLLADLDRALTKIMQGALEGNSEGASAWLLPKKTSDGFP